jgi:hypothetical protein
MIEEAVEIKLLTIGDSGVSFILSNHDKNILIPYYSSGGKILAVVKVVERECEVSEKSSNADRLAINFGTNNYLV